MRPSAASASAATTAPAPITPPIIAPIRSPAQKPKPPAPRSASASRTPTRATGTEFPPHRADGEGDRVKPGGGVTGKVSFPTPPPRFTGSPSPGAAWGGSSVHQPLRHIDIFHCDPAGAFLQVRRGGVAALHIFIIIIRLPELGEPRRGLAPVRRMHPVVRRRGLDIGGRIGPPRRQMLIGRVALDPGA